MSGTAYLILAYAVGLGLLLGYAAVLLAATRNASCCRKEKWVAP
jgi:uncharacterized protein involved in exopolysaccharide biosynthesis